ncbi:unnamed protein product [Urochloa humidicola]
MSAGAKYAASPAPAASALLLWCSPPNYSVPEPGATRDESRLCVACRKNPVPVPDQPPYHICVCHFCRSHGVVCSVCDCGPPVSIGERRSSLAAGMDGRKGNEKENDSGTKESSREDTRRTAARAAGAHGGVEDGGTASASAGASGSQLIPGYPGQNVARSAAPFPDYLRGRSSPTGLLLAAEPGGSAPRQGVHGPHVRGQARRSGNMPPPPAPDMSITAARAHGGRTSAASAGASGTPPTRADPRRRNVAPEPKTEFRDIDLYYLDRANKAALAATGGELPESLRVLPTRTAAEARWERLMESLRRKREASPEKKKKREASTLIPARRSDQQRQAPAPATGQTAAPEDPDPETQPDRSCPRCRTKQGTVAPHHLCRCTNCSGSTSAVVCPFCTLQAVPRMKYPRGTCPGCGKSSGKEALDHICLGDCCPKGICPSCELAGVPRPPQRRDGMCPCCMESLGSALRHFCLCLECRSISGSECPFCTLCEAPSVSRPFDYIKRVAYSLMDV